MPRTSYAIGLGANRRHGRHGAPAAILAAALKALEAAGVAVIARSPVIATRPLGPGGRTYANAAALVATDLDPPGLLALTKRLERAFGRRRGRRWGDRALDIDLLLWSGGRWTSPGLVIPHAGLSQRRFALEPLATIAADWRLPDTGLAVRHLRRRLTARKPLHRSAAAPSP